MTEEERDVLELTVELTNTFSALPVEHPSDQEEFTHAIHRIQDMILSRPARRDMK